MYVCVYLYLSWSVYANDYTYGASIPNRIVLHHSLGPPRNYVNHVHSVQGSTLETLVNATRQSELTIDVT